jgi:ribosomal-protein-serine acetyltransferase
MPTLVTAMFTFPLGEDAALLPLTPLLTDACHELLAANQERLARGHPAGHTRTHPVIPGSERACLDGGNRTPGRDRGASW